MRAYDNDGYRGIMGEVYGNMAVVWARFGRYEKAITAGERAVTLKPDCVEAHLAMGAAIDAYQCVLHIEPNNTRAQFNIGVVHLKAGRCAKAIGAFWDIVSVPRVSYRTLRLAADDYVPPECLPDNEGDTEEYVRGYVGGWRRYARRWCCRIFCDGPCSYTVHGNWTDCGKDGSPYEVGFEEGQGAAADVAGIKTVDAVFP